MYKQNKQSGVAALWITLGIFGVVTMLGAILLVMYVNASRKEINLRTAITAKQTDNKNIRTRVWSILQNQAQVSNEYYDRFNEIWDKAAQGRAGGEVFKMVTEANPKLDNKVVMTLMKSIDSQFTEFSNNQTRLLDLKREHDRLIDDPIYGFFIGSRGKIDVTILQSSETEKAFQTGIDDQKLPEREKKK